MTHSVSNLHEAQTVIVGVDTHKHMHVAVAIDSRGIRLGAHSFGADSEGYRVLPQSTVGVLSLTYLHARVWAVV